ncbi:tRNA lysidine(34) synthetase TilS [Vibrio sp.]|uniref:tRNA lysidine(34) synthetase TilS n=1 Tax=Vibrio sp. TaxID=678 RepID=UPI003D0BE7C1
MSDLYQQFERCISQYRQPNSKLVVAYSGGVDSQVLCHLAQRYRLKQQCLVSLVHVHHGLSANADQWAERCQNWASQARLPIAVERVCLDLASGESVEQLARQARYQALSAHLEEGDLLLTGQHADDQLETFLLALKRGSGPKGLASMAEAKSLARGVLIRPLLGATRKQIEAYAHEQQLPWLEDESNRDTRFDRNFLRHQIAPVLVERWPHICRSVARSAELCGQQELLLDELLADKLNAGLDDNLSLDIATLQASSEPLRAQLLRHWFARQGQRMPSQQQLSTLWQQVALSQPDANPRLRLDDCQVRRFQQRLYLVTDDSSLAHWQGQWQLNDRRYCLPAGLGSLQLAAPQGPMSLALGKIQQLEVSFEPQGLEAHPVGRGHRRKLKKLFQEYGIPSWLRRRTPILLSEGQVVAVAGLFVDKKFAGEDCELIWDKSANFM